ncbi:MAG: hypothetical protein WAQ33_09760 [Gaiellaceae bacterium]
MSLRMRVDEAVREMLGPGEDLVAAVAVKERLVPQLPMTPVFFAARRIVALTSSRLLLLDYFGVIGRHVEQVLACERTEATVSLTNVCGVRLLWVDFARPTHPARRYCVYFRFSKRADALARSFADHQTNVFEEKSA